MRRKPGSSGSGGFNNNQQRSKQRFQQGGGNGGEHRSHNHNNGRPRKNYAAAREKYLSQARDALAAGDRVLAENYFQHADHCYRMMVEEGYQFRNTYPDRQQEQHGNQAAEQHDEPAGASTQAQAAHAEELSEQDSLPETINQLPAFLTAKFDHAGAQAPAEPVVAQSWEE
jgi:hypothetical protein